MDVLGAQRADTSLKGGLHIARRPYKEISAVLQLKRYYTILYVGVQQASLCEAGEGACD